MLTLQVISHQKDSLGQDGQCVFDKRGGSIGRTLGNEWVLPDPERVVSGEHAVVSYRNGAYFIQDVSTNGVFIGEEDVPLGEGNPTELNNGDMLHIGDYDILVTIGEAVAPAETFFDSAFVDEPAAPPSPEPVVEPPVQPAIIPETTDPLLDPASIPRAEDPLAGDSPGLAGSVDPLAPPPAVTPAASEADHRRGEQQFFQMPEARPEAIPEDWDINELLPDPEGAGDGGNEAAVEPGSPQIPPTFGNEPSVAGVPPDPLAATRPEATGMPMAPEAPTGAPAPYPEPARQAPEAEPTGIPASPAIPAGEAPPPTPVPAEGIPPMAGDAAHPTVNPVAPASGGARIPPSDDFQPVAPNEPVAPVAPRAAPQAPPTAPQVPPTVSQAPPAAPQAPSAAPQAPPAAPQAPSPGAPAAGAGQRAAFDAFMRGVDLDISELERLSDAECIAMMENVGQTYRQVVGGMLDIMMARARLKHEFRMDMTMIRPAANNPLKFSAGVDDALHHLLFRRSRGFLPARDAFAEGFRDLKEHEMAMVAGMRAIFNQTMDRFEPDRLEEIFSRQHPGGGILAGFGGREAKYWSLYRQEYERLANDARDHFLDFFGAEFAKAYEEQIRNLSSDGSGDEG